MNGTTADEPVGPWGATFVDGLKCQEILEAAKLSNQRGQWVDIGTL